MNKQMTMNRLNATLIAGATEEQMQPALPKEGTFLKSKRLLSALAALTLLALPVVALAQSDATLADLAPSDGTLTPAFASGSFSYTASVPYTTTTMTVTPLATDFNATVRVNGSPVSYGNPSGPISLTVGANVITTVVVSQDTTATNTYTLTVTREPADATLEYLVPSDGALTPDFASGTFSYTASVPYATASMVVYPVPTDPLATVTVNGSLVLYLDPSPPISLIPGENVITTVVVSQDMTATNTYTLTVTRTGKADLASLVPSAGTLVPAFASSTLRYKDKVPYGSTIMNDPLPMTVTPTAAEPGATITVNGSPVTSGSPSDPINLNAGANVITIVVTGDDGITTQTYTLTVTRDGVVGNAGFEARGAYAPLPDGYDEYPQYASEIWRQWQRTGNGGAERIWNPGVPGCGRQATGSIDEGFGGNAAEGDYIMVVRSSASDGLNYTINLVTGVTNYFEALVQLLPVTFDPTLTYTLTVKVGRPPGSLTYTANWLGYSVQLAVGGVNQNNTGAYAGSVFGGTVIAEDVNNLAVPVNGWVTAKVRYTPNQANAGLAGEQLQVRLCCLEDPLNLSAQGIVAFDDVHLEGDLVPVGDVTPPTLAGSDMVDDKSGGQVPAKTMVTYTVTFSEPMDASTVLAAGFTNAGTAAIVLGTINHVSGGVFTVQVTPTTTGTLRLAVPAGAIMKDVSGNALDTTTAIADNTTITVGAEFVADGTWIVNAADFWNNAVNWTNGIVANGTDKTAFFTADINPQTTISLNAPRTIGNITFTDRTSSHDLQLSGTSPLTLDRSSSAPVIDVTQTGRTLTFAGPIAGNKGLAKSGVGTLKARLAGTISGDTTVNGGFLEIGMGNGTYAGNISIASGATLQYAVDDRKWQSKMTLDGVISGAGTLTKGGRTGLILTRDNTYTGVTTLSTGPGVLVLKSANALPGGIGTSGGVSALTFNGGVLGLGAGDFTRPLAAAGVTNGVNFTGDGGWAAYGADRVVNLGGASAPITWATANTGFNGKNLIFGMPLSNTYFITISAASTPSTHKVTLQNPLDLGTANRNIRVEKGSAAVDAELSGVISGSTGCSLTKTYPSQYLGAGTLALTGNNTYDGPTTNQSGTLIISSLASVGGGSSSLGAPTTVANGTIALGLANADGRTATLKYTGSGHSSDRVINLAATIGGVMIDASGTGALVLTSAMTATGAGSKTLSLIGNSTAGNTIGGAIVDNSAANKTSLTKAGTGTWVLSGANTYTGNSTVSGGTLLVNGLLAADSAVTVNSGGTLGGSGTINGTVAVNAGGTNLLGASGATLTLANATAPSYASLCTLKILASASTLDKVSVPNATAGNSVANVALVIDTTGLSGVVPSTIIYSAGGAITGPFNSTNIIGNTAYTATLDYSNPNQIKLALSSSLTPPTLSGFGPLSGKSFPLTFSGPSGQSYQVLTSTNVARPLASWTVLSSGTFGASPVIYTDTSATNAHQFYRIKSP